MRKLQDQAPRKEYILAELKKIIDAIKKGQCEVTAYEWTTNWGGTYQFTYQVESVRNIIKDL